MQDTNNYNSRSGLTRPGDQDFFHKAVGAVKKVLVSYGPNGRSRGEATVIFSKSTKAAEAQKQFNGVKVDDKAMRVTITMPILQRLDANAV